MEEGKEENNGGGDGGKEGRNIFFSYARQTKIGNFQPQMNQFSVVVEDNLQDIFGSSEYLVITKDAAQKTHPRRTPPAA